MNSKCIGKLSRKQKLDVIKRKMATKLNNSNKRAAK